MKAAVYYENGGPEVLKYEDAPDPTCYPGGVIIRVEAIAIEGGDVLNRFGGPLVTKPHIVGYQAAGSLGRRLVEGAKKVTIFGETIAVQAQIHTLGGFSAHAGQTDLINWFDVIAPVKPRVVLTHGENGPRAALAKLIAERHGLNALLPQLEEVIEI